MAHSPSFCFLRPTEAFLFALPSVLLAILLIFFSNQAEERYKTRCIGWGDGSSFVFHCQVSAQSFAENWLSKFFAWYLQSLNLSWKTTNNEAWKMILLLCGFMLKLRGCTFSHWCLVVWVIKVEAREKLVTCSVHFPPQKFGSGSPKLRPFLRFRSPFRMITYNG